MTDVIDLEHTRGAREHQHEGRPHRRQIADWGVDDTFRRRERSARQGGDGRASALDRVDGLPPAAGHGADPFVGGERAGRGEPAYADGEPVDPFSEDREGELTDPGDERPAGGRRRRERQVEDWFGDAPMPAPARGRRFRRAEDWSAPGAPRSATEPLDELDDPIAIDERAYADEELDERELDDQSRARHARRPAREQEQEARRRLERDRAAREAPAPRAPASRGPSADELWSAGSAGKPQPARSWTRPNLSLLAPSRSPHAAPAGAADRRPAAEPAPEPPLQREYVDDSGRRTVVVRGQSIGAEAARAVAALAEHEGRAPVDHRARGIARPERLAAWAVGLGFLLILIAVSTANAATI